MSNKTSLPGKLFTSFILLGILLALINFLNNRSLWLDEAFLALNIVNKPVHELLAPLDHNQVAPIGFLVIEKFFAALFGNTDWSMRVLPMVAFLASIPLIASIVSQLTANKKVGLFSAAWFSLSYWSIYFSSEVKQYMSDVFICLTITFLVLSFLEKRKGYYGLILAGVLSVWFSNIAVILLFSGGLLLLYNAVKTPDQLLFKTILLLGCWVFSFGVYYFFFIHDHPSEKYMLAYWEKSGAFFPQDVFSSLFYSSLLKKTSAYFSLLGAGKFGLATLPFLIAGLIHLGKKKLILLFALPVIIHLALAYLKMYPFSLRLILYLQPLLILVITVGVYRIFSTKALRPLQTIALSGILVLNLSLIALRGFPIEREEIKKSISHLNKKASPTDQLFIYSSASMAFLFYESNLAVYPAIKANNNIIFHKSSRNDWTQYDKAIREIPPHPVWLLFSHVHRPKGPEANISEEEYIIKRMEANDFKIVDQQIFKGSSVYKAIPQQN